MAKLSLFIFTKFSFCLLTILFLTSLLFNSSILFSSILFLFSIEFKYIFEFSFFENCSFKFKFVLLLLSFISLKLIKLLFKLLYISEFELLEFKCQLYSFC